MRPGAAKAQLVMDATNELLEKSRVKASCDESLIGNYTWFLLLAHAGLSLFADVYVGFAKVRPTSLARSGPPEEEYQKRPERQEEE